MSFVSSLLQAIVRLDGEAVVLHVGEKPYIVTPTDQVDLATKGLTIEAATGILNQLLPPEPQNALEEFGAVQYQMLPSAEYATRSPRGDTATSSSAFVWNVSGATSTGKRTAGCTRRVSATWNGISRGAASFSAPGAISTRHSFPRAQ